MRHLATLSMTRQLIFTLDVLANSHSDSQTVVLRGHYEAAKISVCGRLTSLKTKSNQFRSSADLHESPSP